MNKFLSKLDKTKIKIHQGKNLIKMKLFLSFLTVKVKRNISCFGSDTGWTEYVGENDLIITGGIYKNIEYLDSIQYKKNLDNPYNNYVNPLHLLKIFNEEGKKFFRDYYEKDIEELIIDASLEIKKYESKVEKSIAYKKYLIDALTTILY